MKRSLISISHIVSSLLLVFVQSKKRTRTKMILGWTHLWGNVPIENIWDSSKCMEKRCEFTSDRRRALEADVLVWYSSSIGVKPSQPKQRLQRQQYLFFSMEAPPLVPPMQNYANFFNLTMTYRRDSDIINLFGSMRYRIEYGSVLTAAAFNKTKLVAWFVRNCKSSSKREAYVRKLQKYIAVDIYGACGPLKCPRRLHQYTECEELLNSTYKFYLSFENAVCKDWVTEKFFQRVFAYVVPVVLRRADYLDKVPPGSFIAVDDFGSVKELAQYLKSVKCGKTTQLGPSKDRGLICGISDRSICTTLCVLYIV